MLLILLLKIKEVEINISSLKYGRNYSGLTKVHILVVNISKYGFTNGI